MVAKSSAAADLGDSTQPASLTPVIWAVVIASFGAFAFGYHCGIVNGPLNAIAADLGFAGNAALQGTVSSISALFTFTEDTPSVPYASWGMLPPLC